MITSSNGSCINGCTCFILEEAHTNARFISCDGHQFYAFKGWGVDHEVEGVGYIEMQHRLHRHYQGAEISN